MFSGKNIFNALLYSDVKIVFFFVCMTYVEYCAYNIVRQNNMVTIKAYGRDKKDGTGELVVKYICMLI